MTSNNGGKSIDDYPHWKAALFDGEKAVNLRCFLKYCTWHGSYMLLAAAVIVWSGITKAVNAFPSEKASASTSTATRAVSSPKAKKASRYVVRGGAVAIVLAAVLLMGWFAVTRPMKFAGIMAMSAVLMAILFGGAFLIGKLQEWGVFRFIKQKLALVAGAVLSLFVNKKTKEGATVVVKKGKKAKQKAPDTKGVRRVYGKCPVNMNMSPKWFDKYVDDD